MAVNVGTSGGRGRQETGGNGDPRFDLAEINKRLANLINIGLVVGADYDAGKVRVKLFTASGKFITEWLPWLVKRAGKSREWAPPEVGEQVVVFAPSGEVAAGFVGFCINQKLFKHLAKDPNIERRSWGLLVDGDLFSCPFEQWYKAPGAEHHWQYLPATGCHRLEIGNECLVLVGRDADNTPHIKLGVGETHILIRNGQIAFQIGDGKGQPLTSFVLDANTIRASAKDGGHFYLSEDQVHMDVGRKAYVNITNGMVRARTGSGEQLLMGKGMIEMSSGVNSVLRITTNVITAELINSESRLMLFSGGSVLQSGKSMMFVNPSTASVCCPNSLLSLAGNGAVLMAPSFKSPKASEINSMYSPADYSTGAEQTFMGDANRIELPAFHKSRPRWTMEEGKEPYMPKN